MGSLSEAHQILDDILLKNPNNGKRLEISEIIKNK
jgi:hypothetical protein